MRLVWLIVVLFAVVNVEMADFFLSRLAPNNCDAGDAAVCVESLFFLE